MTENQVLIVVGVLVLIMLGVVGGCLAALL